MKLNRHQREAKRHARHLRSSAMRHQIQWPRHESEFEVHANLYAALRDVGFIVRGCVQAWCDDPDPHRVYFDLVVFDRINGKAIAVIECKNDQCSRCELASGTRQERRYGMFGVPVLKCGGSPYIGRTIERISSLALQSSPALMAMLAD